MCTPLLLFHPNHQTPTPIPTSATDMADPCMLTPLSDSTSYEITTPANPPLHWPNVPVPLEPTPPVTGALSQRAHTSCPATCRTTALRGRPHPHRRLGPGETRWPTGQRRGRGYKRAGCPAGTAAAGVGLQSTASLRTQPPLRIRRPPL
jgi:hypothetical protein